MELLCSPEDTSAHLATKYPHPPPPSPTFVTFYCVTFFMALIIPKVLYMCHFLSYSQQFYEADQGN